MAAATPEAHSRHVSAWLIDDDGDVWLLTGPDPAGTGMAVYKQDDLHGSGIRALAIEDAHGIRTRGPNVTLVA